MRPKGLIQAYQLRDIAYKLASQAFNPDQVFTDVEAEQAKAVTALIRAWAEADDHVRIHRGKPLPGSLRPEGQSASAKRRAQRLARANGSAGGSGVPVVLPADVSQTAPTIVPQGTTELPQQAPVPDPTTKPAA